MRIVVSACGRVVSCWDAEPAFERPRWASRERDQLAAALNRREVGKGRRLQRGPKLLRVPLEPPARRRPIEPTTPSAHRRAE